MDYPYFQTATPQAYPYVPVGLPPTPTQTNSISEHDFSSNPSPPVRSHFHTLDSDPLSILTPIQDGNYDFQFESYNHFSQNTQNGLHHKPQTPHPQHHKPSYGATPRPNSNNQDPDSGMNNGNGNQPGSNSDDEDNMTPAQTRRKAQNRAA